MWNILHTAGIDEVCLAMIKPIVDTCRACRAWQKRGNVVMPSIDVATKFLEKGETNLLFYKRHIACHCIDRGLRYNAGCPSPDRSKESLLDNYTTSWFQSHGPFQQFYSD
eukprot:8463968-Karenia_brevis.AAC.1